MCAIRNHPFQENAVHHGSDWLHVDADYYYSSESRWVGKMCISVEPELNLCFSLIYFLNHLYLPMPVSVSLYSVCLANKHVILVSGRATVIPHC